MPDMASLTFFLKTMEDTLPHVWADGAAPAALQFCFYPCPEETSTILITLISLDE